MTSVLIPAESATSGPAKRLPRSNWMLRPTVRSKERPASFWQRSAFVTRRKPCFHALNWCLSRANGALENG